MRVATPILGLGLALLAPPAVVQAAPSEARAQAHVDRGTALFKKRRYEAALAEFERAVPLIDDAPTRAVVQHNIARCFEELKRPEEAVAALDAYLGMPDDASAQSAARKKREGLLRAGFGTVHIDARPSGADCAIRRLRPEPTRATPTRCPKATGPLLAGEYEAEVTIGLRGVRRSFAIQVGGRTDVMLDVEQTEAEQPDGGTIAIQDEAPAPFDPWPWLSGAGGLAALVGAGVFYSAALDELEGGDAAMDELRQAGTEAEYDDRKRSVRAHDDAAGVNRALAVTFGVAGLALAGVSAWLFLRPAPAGGPESVRVEASPMALTVRF